MSWLRRAAVTDAFAQAADAPALALRELRVTMGGRVLIERLSMSAGMLSVFSVSVRFTMVDGRAWWSCPA
ncbi:hypothetical protein ACQCRA_18400, partial [Ralstonia pseudosolanacearum]